MTGCGIVFLYFFITVLIFFPLLSFHTPDISHTKKERYLPKSDRSSYMLSYKYCKDWLRSRWRRKPEERLFVIYRYLINNDDPDTEPGIPQWYVTNLCLRSSAGVFGNDCYGATMTHARRKSLQQCSILSP